MPLCFRPIGVGETAVDGCNEMTNIGEGVVEFGEECVFIILVGQVVVVCSNAFSLANIVLSRKKIHISMLFFVMRAFFHGFMNTDSQILTTFVLINFGLITS